MVHLRNTSLSENNVPDVEQHVPSTVGTTENTNSIVVALSMATSIPTNPRPMHTAIRDPMPSYMSGFAISLVFRDFRSDIPTPMMEGLHNNTSTYVDNNATISSPLNPYVASGSANSNPGQVTQHGGTEFALLNTSSLTTNSMLSIRQQID